MATSDYLKRQGIDADKELSELSREEAKERAIETAYYNACLSDSTYHGVNHNAKVNTITSVVKTWPQFDHTDFVELDDAADELIDSRRGKA